MKKDYDTHTLVHDLHGEQFAVSAGVAPGSDVALVGDAGADGPPGGDAPQSTT